MSDKHVSDNIFDQIQQLGNEFRSNWKSNQPPRIEDFLAKVPENARETLFRNLLPVDIRYRERNRQQLGYDDYLNRFPQFQRAIGDAFNHTTSIEVQAVHETADDDDDDPTSDATTQFGTVPPRPFEPVQPTETSRIGDYQLLRELGRGGFGVVYEALHERHGIKVALKTLLTAADGQEIDAERLYKFRREFRSLSEINHPNLVGMQTLEVDQGQWFFTMDLVDGVDFFHYVRPHGQLDEERLRSAVRQLAAGVLALHDRSILHCDLKPSNVLVSPEGHVWILDFGLVTHLEGHSDHSASLQSQQFAGTPRYMAPEQVSGERYPASDWYAIGTMLYEALVGQAPFHGSSTQLLISKCVDDPPTLVGRDEVPADLAAMVDRLLYRDPKKRANPDEIVEALGLDPATVSVGSRDDDLSEPRSAEEFSAPELIGREEQIATLQRTKQTFLTDRQPQVVWIAGLSGEGKSALADKFLESFRIEQSALVLSGRCYDRESVPFKAVDVLIESLVRFLRSREPAQVTAWLPRDIQMLARLFPTLRRVEAIERQPPLDLRSLDDRQIRYRGFFALSELLVTIGRETPLVLFIDDLQWGDADSAEVLVDILAGDHPPALLLLGSYRSDEAEQSPFLQEWHSRTDERESSLIGKRVKVGPLTKDQCVDFVLNQIGISISDLNEHANDMIADTKGNPYFLEQLIEGFDRATGNFKPVPLREILERKLSLLPDSARDLLNAIAIAGQAVAIDEVSLVAGHDTPLFSTVTHMRSERLVRLIGSGGHELVDTYHDKIRETLQETLEHDEQRKIHLDYGKLIENKEQISITDVLQYLEQDASSTEQVPPRTERMVDLAFHFHAAGDPRSWAYHLMAGEIAYRLYASEEAVTFLNRAHETCPTDVSDNIKYRLFHRLGVSQSRLKQFEAALKSYQIALGFANSKLARAHAHAGISVVQQSQGKFESATKSNDAALSQLGRKRPRGIRAIARMIWQLASVLMIPAGWFRKEGGELGRINAFEMTIYENLCQYIFEQAGSLVDYPYALSRLGTLAKVVPSQDHAASGKTQFAAHIAVSGLPVLAQWLLTKRTESLEQIGNQEARGICAYYEGNILFGLVKLETADERLRAAKPLLLRTGSHMFGVACTHIHRHLKHEIGTASEELECAELVLQLAEDSGDSRGQCWGHYDIAAAYARLGKIEESFNSLQNATKFMRITELNLSESIYYGTKAYIYLQGSLYDLAREAAEKAWELIFARKTIMGYTIRMYPWLLDSTLGPKWLDSPSSKVHGRVRELNRTASLIALCYPLLRAPLQRMRGRLFQIQGRSDKAVDCFTNAAITAQKIGNRYEQARSLLDLSVVQVNDSKNCRKEAIQLLKQMESVIPRAEAWQLGDQFDEAVVAPEFDVTAWNREHGD